MLISISGFAGYCVEHSKQERSHRLCTQETEPLPRSRAAIRAPASLPGRCSMPRRLEPAFGTIPVRRSRQHGAAWIGAESAQFSIRPAEAGRTAWIGNGSVQTKLRARLDNLVDGPQLLLVSSHSGILIPLLFRVCPVQKREGIEAHAAQILEQQSGALPLRFVEPNCRVPRLRLSSLVWLNRSSRSRSSTHRIMPTRSVTVRAEQRNRC